VPRGREIDVTPREGTCRAVRDMSAALGVADWRRLGVRLPGGRPLPKTDLSSSLVSGSKRSFLVNTNYDSLLAYNCANTYALSVALLADRIAN
jgi:membrane-bound lytic murein transglycosylase B